MYQGIGISDAQKLASPCSKKKRKVDGDVGGGGGWYEG